MGNRWMGFIGIKGMTEGTEEVVVPRPRSGQHTKKVVALSIFLILLSLISLAEFAKSLVGGGVNLDKKVPFKCTSCNNLVWYTIRDLQKKQKPGKMDPMMGPMTMDCPKCHKKTLTQAVECPKCKEIFVMKMDPAKGLFDDKCPKCKESYAKVWQEKYRTEQGKK
jgi:hypothetical protein